MEMGKTENAAAVAEDDEIFRFSDYVAANIKCADCGKPMKMLKKDGFFLGCTGYPSCRKTAKIDTELVEAYFYKDKKLPVKCPRCGFSLEAKKGSFGVYVVCCGRNNHKYKLNEI